jgi:hypothetical protein
MNLDDVIVPGESAAGIRVGQRINQVLAMEGSVEAERFHGIEKYVFGAVTLWARDGLITQVGVRAPYTGKLASGIGIGSTIGEVESAVGRIGEDDEDNLVVPTSPGWCFETEVWRRGKSARDNRAAKITEIFVFSPKR